MQPFKPREYQQSIMAHALRHERSNIWAGMGTGKTASTLSVIDFLINVTGDVRKVLVLAPKRVANSVWPTEARKWSNMHHLRVVSIAGRPEATRHALVLGPHDVLCVNYDNLQWLVDNYGDQWQWDMVVADESTRLKSFRLGGKNGKRARALATVAHRHVKRWVNLTGTPSPNGLEDLWGQCWFVDGGARLGHSFTSFKERWFSMGYDRVWIPNDHAQGQIEDKLADVTIAVNAKNHFDLPPLMINDLVVDLPPDAMRKYRTMESEYLLSLPLADGTMTQIEAKMAMVKSMKCLQIASGSVYDEEQRSHHIHDAKLEALDSIIEEAAGMPVLVAYHFKPALAAILKRYPQARSLDSRQSTIDDWNAGRIPLLCVHPQSAGHGLNLQDGGNIIVFFTVWWSLEQYEQTIERIGPTRQAQSGHNRPVFVHRIVANGTLDREVVDVLEGKASVQSALMNKMAKINGAKAA